MQNAISISNLPDEGEYKDVQKQSRIKVEVEFLGNQERNELQDVFYLSSKKII